MQMRHAAFSCAVLFCAALVTSCTETYGNKSVASAAVYGQLAPGRATRQDVYDALGQPSDVVVMEKGTLWTYHYRHARNNLVGNIPLFGIGLIAGGKNGDVHTVLALFDRKGVLSSRTASRRELYTSNLFSLKRSLDGMIGDDLSHGRVEAEMKRIGRPFNAQAAKDAKILEEALH